MAKLTQPDSDVLELSWQAPPHSFDPDKQPSEREDKIDGLIVGRLVGWDRFANPLVIFHGIQEPGVPARSAVALSNAHAGREVVLMFEKGANDAPIILGLIEKPVASPDKPVQPDKTEIDGKTLRLTAEKEIVLRCGDASITLTRAGKIIIRGAYVLSRSSGVNRITGGVVHIN